MYVSIFFVRVLASELSRRGLDHTRTLEAAHVSNTELADPTFRLPIDRYELAMRAALRELEGEPAPGLRLGESWPLTGYLIGHLCTNARSIRNAVELAQKYRRILHEGMSIRLVEEGDDASIVFENQSSDAETARFEAEAIIVFFLRLGRFLMGRDGPPKRVTFLGHEPAETRSYEEVLGVRPTFDAERNAIVFPRFILDAPSISHDPGLAPLLERRCDELLELLDDDARLVGRVRDLLRIAGDPARVSLDELATRVGTSARVLQRKLQSRGTSVSELVDEARRAIALDAISYGTSPIKEIADRLGFSEPSAFHRAFKRWTGRTPAELREKRRSNRPGPV